MTTLVAFALALCYLSSFVMGKLPPPGGAQSLQTEPVDSIKTVQQFEHLVSISDWDNDTVFECVYAHRGALDLDAGTVTYVWNFPSTGESIPLTAKFGDGPGEFQLLVPGDSTEREGKIYYSDYENCLVLDVEYRGHYCALWVRSKLKDNAPQNCIDHFVDICGVIVPTHSRDLCPDGEGDY